VSSERSQKRGASRGETSRRTCPPERCNSRLRSFLTATCPSSQVLRLPPTLHGTAKPSGKTWRAPRSNCLRDCCQRSRPLRRPGRQRGAGALFVFTEALLGATRSRRLTTSPDGLGRLLLRIRREPAVSAVSARSSETGGAENTEPAAGGLGAQGLGQAGAVVRCRVRYRCMGAVRAE
jgi:hypothetical protein